MKLARWWTIGLSVLVLAGPALAQRPGFGRGPGGPFGGGLLALLRIPEVQREIQLQEAQIDLVRQLGQELGERRRQAFQEFRNLSPEERERRLAAFREEENKKLSEILDAKQMARLRQLELQQAGARALGRKEIADALKLTPEQRQKIEAALNEEREQMRSIFQSFQGGQATPEQRQEAFQKMRTLREQTDQKVLGVLTDAQKKQFESMKGAPFRFPEFRPGGNRARARA